MEYELHESAGKLPKATMNTIWYLWELYCKTQDSSSFVLTRTTNKQKIKVVGTECVHTFEMSPCVEGTVVIVRDGDRASMIFHEGI